MYLKKIMINSLGSAPKGFTDGFSHEDICEVGVSIFSNETLRTLENFINWAIEEKEIFN